MFVMVRTVKDFFFFSIMIVAVKKNVKIFIDLLNLNSIVMPFLHGRGVPL